MKFTANTIKEVREILSSNGIKYDSVDDPLTAPEVTFWNRGEIVAVWRSKELTINEGDTTEVIKGFNTKFPEKYKYYNIDLNNPIIDLRWELKAIPLAIEHGWEVVEGETFADIVCFKKGNERIWATLKVHRAELVDEAYIKHKNFDTFKEALNYNGGN